MPASICCPKCSTELTLTGDYEPGSHIRCVDCKFIFPFPKILETIRASESAVADRFAATQPASVDESLAGPSNQHETPKPASFSNKEIRAPSFSSPPPLAHAGQTPGLPKPSVMNRAVAAQFRPPFHETVLGVTVIAAILVAIVTGSLLAYRYLPSKEPVSGDQKAGLEPTEAKVEVGSKKPATPNEDTSRVFQELPTELVGTWDARTDDNQTFTIQLNRNSTAQYARSTAGPVSTPTQGHWMVRSKTSDEIEIDFIPLTGGISTIRFSISAVSPEAFTTTRFVIRGTTSREEMRFVRRVEP